MLKRLRLVVVAGIAGVAVFGVGAATSPSSAQAASNIDGHCAMHIGSLVSRNQEGTQYHYTTGKVSDGTHCYGQVVILRHAKGSRVGVPTWRSYNMTAWNENNILLIASGSSTVIGCNAVGKGLLVAIEAATAAGSDGLAAPGVDAAAAGVGCAIGAGELFNLLPDGPNNIHDVREIK